MYSHQLRYVLRKAAQGCLTCFLFMDERQVLSDTEINHDIDKDAEEEGCQLERLNLSEKIRTNKEIFRFIKALFNFNVMTEGRRSPDVRLFYANSSIEAHRKAKELGTSGYKFIPLTSSSYGDKYSLQMLDSFGDNTHSVTGQEFDRVAVALGPNFFYNKEGLLQSEPHPYEEYKCIRLLFQALTRTRLGLAIIVYENLPLFRTIANTLIEMRK